METVILCVFAVVILAAGFTGLFLGLGHAHWRLGLASVGVLVIAAVYLVAAKRGRPL